MKLKTEKFCLNRRGLRLNSNGKKRQQLLGENVGVSELFVLAYRFQVLIYPAAVN